MADRQNNTTDTKESVREKLKEILPICKKVQFFREKWVCFDHFVENKASFKGPKKSYDFI